MFQSRSVGIDIQPGFVRIAVATQQGGRTKILNLVEEAIPDETGREPAQAASIIKNALRENGTDDSDVCVACLPASGSINRTVRMPLTDPSKIKDTLKYQIEAQIPYPVDHVISDCVMIRKLDDGSEVLAIAVAKELISERLELLTAAGVDPQILTLDALALADFYITPFDFSPDRVTALLLTGSENSFLGFFVGERLVGYRNLDGVSEGDESAVSGLVKELRRSFVGFQSTGDETAEIGALCLGGAAGEAIREVLQEEFRDLSVRRVEFNERMLAEIPPSFSDIAEACGLAVALAHAGLGARANAVNFMREEFAPPSALSRVRPNLIFSAAVLALALVAWFAGIRAQIHSQANHMKALNEEMVKIFSDTMPGIKSPGAAEQRIKQEQEKFKILKNYSSEYVSPIEVLAEVATGASEIKNLSLNDLADSDNVLRMTGVVESFDDIDAFKKRVEGSPLFHDVKIDSATKSDKGKKVNFRIRARIGRESASGAGGGGL